MAALLALAACAGTGQPSAEAYRVYEARLVARGGLRTETAPPDAPFDNATLLRSFERIALRREVIAPGQPPGGWTPSALQRWAGPVRWVALGGGVRASDRAEITDLFDRIAALTGLDIAEDRENPNFFVFITTPQERPGLSAAFASRSPVLAGFFDQWRGSAEQVCFATNGLDPDRPNTLALGFAFLGDELPGLLRRSCIHEEIVQAMGLPNDDFTVRPSMFNDDEEFALLTDHDAWLLRLLYHPRLRPGMTAAQARPVVARLLAELRPEGGV